MRSATVAPKYARALFEAAKEDGKVERVARDMASLAELRVEDPAFLDFLMSPEVLTENKLDFIRGVFGPRLDALTVNFLRLLVDKARIDFLPEIGGTFQRMVEEYEGVLKAQVVSAVPLSQDHERRLKTRLDGLTGKNVVLEKRVEPAVLGGVVVILGNRIIDGSLRYGLRRLRERLLSAEVN